MSYLFMVWLYMLMGNVTFRFQVIFKCISYGFSSTKLRQLNIR